MCSYEYGSSSSKIGKQIPPFTSTRNAETHRHCRETPRRWQPEANGILGTRGLAHSAVHNLKCLANVLKNIPRPKSSLGSLPMSYLRSSQGHPGAPRHGAHVEPAPPAARAGQVSACGFGPRSQGQLRKLGLRGQTHQANERVWPLQGTRERASFTLNLALDLPDPSFVNSWRSRSCSILGSLKSGCAAHAHLLRLPLFTWDTENAHRRNPQVDPSLARRHLHPRSRLPGVMCTHNTRRVTLTDSRWTVSFKAAPLAGFPHRHERLEVGSNLEVHITPRTGEAHLTEQPHVDAGLTT